MKKMLLMSMVLPSLLLVTACNQQAATKTNESSSHTQESTTKKESAHLDYDAQEEWEQVAGKMQSPIDIPASSAKEMTDQGNITLNYSAKITKAENNGHSIQLADSGSAVINQRNFELTQFHFHAQSEHTVDGKHYPMEVHFVNQAQDGRIAVIGVFFEEGKENKGFQEVLDDVKNQSDNEITDIETMFPENKSYYHYLGSLTTPPLSENVEWYVLKNPVQVSAEQIKEFQKFYDHNNREIQPLNDRAVLMHNE